MNPFLINNYLSPEYFCDRENETEILINNINNQTNTSFFAQRRIGKTGLIHHVFFQLKNKEVACIYMDIYATQNLKDLSNQLANSIYKLFPENKAIGKRFWEAIKLLRPVISINEITGNPELSLDITQNQQFERTIVQLLEFLDQQNIKIVLAIDEFQQILSYPEKNVEALLRTVIQQLKNVNFIFCGSNQKMMHQIFNNAKRPFYASTKSINLQKIKSEFYATFIKKHFESNRFVISDEAILVILNLSSNHTFFTQQLCHELYAFEEKNIQKELVNQVLNQILNENEGVYYQYRSLLTLSQWKILKAIAIEEKVERPYAQKFVNEHQLGTAANVRRGIKSLLDKEVIFYHAAVNQPYYEVQDKFLMRWLQYKF